MNPVEDSVNTGEPCSKHARKGPRHHQHQDILRFVQQAPDDINWTIDQAEFDDPLLRRKTRLLALTVFHSASAGVLVVLVRSSSFVLIKPYWREVIFLIVLLKVGRTLSQ